MKNPTNFMVGKLSDSISELENNYRDQVDDRDLELDTSKLENFKKEIEETEKEAEDKGLEDDEKGEFFKKKYGTHAEEDSEEESENEESEDQTEFDNWSRVQETDYVFEWVNENDDVKVVVERTGDKKWSSLVYDSGEVREEIVLDMIDPEKAMFRAEGWMNENDELMESQEDDSSEDKVDREDYGGMGASRRYLVDKLQEMDDLEMIDEINSKEELEDYIREMSVESYMSPHDRSLETLDSVYNALTEEARDEYVQDRTVKKRLNSARRQFNDWMGKRLRLAKMPSPVESGGANYPASKARKRSRVAEEAKEELNEKLDKLRGSLNGAKGRALESIGSSEAEFNEEQRKQEREMIRDKMEKGDIVKFRNPNLQVGRVKRINQKSITVEFYSDYYDEYQDSRVEIPAITLDKLPVETIEQGETFLDVEVENAEPEALDMLEDEDIDYINDLDSPPVNLTTEMVEKFREQREEEENSEPEETVIVKRETAEGEIKTNEVKESNVDSVVEALEDPPHGTNLRIWVDDELVFENEEELEDQEEDFDPMEAVKELTREGLMVSKDAVDTLERGDVKRIKMMSPPPMYVDKGFVEGLREDDLPERDYSRIKIIKDVPDFTGLDGKVYTVLDEGSEGELPAGNAEILVNRGNAEMIEEGDIMEDRSESSDDSSSEEEKSLTGSHAVSEIKKVLRENDGEMDAEMLLDQANVEESTLNALMNMDDFQKDGDKVVLSNFEDIERAVEFIKGNVSTEKSRQVGSLRQKFPGERSAFDRALEKLKREGELYEPKQNHIQAI